MKDELLTYYERELSFIRQMGAEFGANYPKVARRLQLEAEECQDPHVERLIEASALLAARVRHKVDDEFPEITEALLGTLYPHFLRPIPSMAVAQFQADPEQGKLSTGYLVERHTALYSRPVQGATCRFRTCYPVTLWPLAVTGASMGPPTGFSPDTLAGDAAAVIRIEMKCAEGLRLPALDLGRLRFYLSGEAPVAHTLYELIFSRAYRVVLRDLPKTARSAQAALPGSALQPVGFSREEGLLPYPDRSFLGYRLLQEYFSFPEKFLFFDLAGLDRIPKAGFGDAFEILIFLQEFERKERMAHLEQTVGAETFRLGCTPVVNLFEQCAEPIRLTHTKTEYQVVPDVYRQTTTEVYSVDRVVSTTPGREEVVEYEPFYSFRHAYHGEPGQAYWYSSRQPSTRQGDGGTEVYMSFADLGFRPALPAAETLTAHVTCTNRDLAGKLPMSGEFGELEMETGSMVRVRCLGRPTPTVRPPAGRSLQWRLISHLALNHLSIVEGGRAALQEILQLYDFSDSPVIRRQIGGMTGVTSRRQIAPVESEAGVVYCQGLGVEIEFDEEQYVGSGVFVLAAVLERFLGLYSALNSFSQLTARTRQRKGVLKQWAPRASDQILL